MKYLFCDVETTGLDPEKHALIQIAGIVDIDGEEKESFNIKIQPFPNQTISKESLKVNGLSLQDLKEYNKPSEGYAKFTEILSKYVSKFDKKDKFFMVGYNSNFDDSFIRKFFKNCGDEYYGSWFWWPTIDIAPFCLEYFKEERHAFPNFKLSTVSKAFGIEVDNSRLHDAVYDSILTRDIYMKMICGLKEKV